MLGLIGAVLFVAGFYWLGVLGARSVGGGFSARAWRSAFVHTLVPIALAYVAAHYFTLLLFQGQAHRVPDLRPARRGLGHLRHGRHARSTTR